MKREKGERGIQTVSGEGERVVDGARGTGGVGDDLGGEVDGEEEGGGAGLAALNRGDGALVGGSGGLDGSVRAVEARVSEVVDGEEGVGEASLDGVIAGGRSGEGRGRDGLVTEVDNVIGEREVLDGVVKEGDEASNAAGGAASLGHGELRRSCVFGRFVCVSIMCLFFGFV